MVEIHVAVAHGGEEQQEACAPVDKDADGMEGIKLADGLADEEALHFAPALHWHGWGVLAHCGDGDGGLDENLEDEVEGWLVALQMAVWAAAAVAVAVACNQGQDKQHKHVGK